MVITNSHTIKNPLNHIINIKALPIVSIAKDECTKMKVEQLASTRAISAVAIALPVMESPGQPYPLGNTTNQPIY